MPIARGRIFRSGNSAAIRLPKDVAFGDDTEVLIIRSGDVITIHPAATTIPAMLARLRVLPVLPEIERRDLEEIPEREGL